MQSANASPLVAPPLTFRDLAAILWRRRWLAGAAGIAALALVLIAASRITPLFQAHASLAVERERQAVDFGADPQFREIGLSLLNTQRELLMSLPVLEAAYQRSDLRENPAYAGSADPIEVLRQRLEVTTNKDSWVIAAALADEQPERAARGLEAVVTAFLQRQTERQASRSQGAVTFLKDQVLLGRAELDRARERSNEFRREKGIQSTDPDRNHVALRLNELIQQRSELQRQAAGAEAVLAQVAVAEALPEGERTAACLRIAALGGDGLVIEQQQQLFALTTQQAQLGQRFLEKHPRMLEIERQIALKRVQLAEAIARAAAALRASAQAIASQSDELASRIAQDQQELAAYRTGLLTLQALEQETATKQQLFEQLLTRLGEEQVSSQMGVQPVTVLNPAKAVFSPVNLKRPVLAAIALLAAAGAAVAAALVGEALDRRIRGADGAQELTGLPVLATVPQIANLAPLGRGGDPEKPPLLAEAYRGLRTSLHLARRGEGCQCLVITSPHPGEGKSTVATRLAVSMASTGVRVLLIDADMRKPTLHHQVGEPGERGLSFLLAGYNGIAPQATSYANLDFLGVGVRPPNPAELLHSPALGYLVQRAREDYAFIIVDTPPMTLVSDALVISEIADGIVMVVRDRVTAKAGLRRAMARCEPIARKLIGLVVNGESLKAGRNGYYYNYRYALGKDPAGAAVRA